MSMVPPPASMIKTFSPGYEYKKNPTPGGNRVTDLQVFTRLGMGNTEVETCFAFGHEVDSGAPGRGVGDNTRFDCCGS